MTDEPPAPVPEARRLGLTWGSDTPITYSLVGLLVLAFGGELAWALTRGGSAWAAISQGTQDGLSLYALGALYARSGEPWRAVSSVFLHAGWAHLALNVYSLLVLGVMAERLLGRARVLLAFLLAGLAGSVATLVFAPTSLAVGASGAIFGLAGAVVGRIYAGRPAAPPQVRALMGGLVIVVLVNLAAGFAISGVDNAAHLGGLAAGLLVGVLVPSPPQRLARAGGLFLNASALALFVLYAACLLLAVTHLGELPPG